VQIIRLPRASYPAARRTKPVAVMTSPDPGATGRRWIVASELPWIALVAAVFALTLAASWHRWSDPIVDVGREMNQPLRLLEGEQLYSDVRHIYGPLSPFVHAAIYRVLPDCHIEWRDVMIGAIGTTILFNMGEYLISLYLGSSTVASRYGAAGGVLILLLWVYYTAQIFLLGAEFTRVWSKHHGSLRDVRVAAGAISEKN